MTDLPPSPELDASVTAALWPGGHWGQDDCGDFWSPSTNIAHAWEVIEKLRADGFRPVLLSDWGHQWQCLIYQGKTGPLFPAPFYDTAPHVICLAALRAVS